MLDRAADAYEKSLDRTADANEKALNRTADTQSWSRKSLDVFDKAEFDYNKTRWFKRNPDSLESVKEGKIFHKGILTKPTTSVPLEKDIGKKDSFVKETLNEQSILTTKAAENVASGSKGTPGFIPSSLDLATDSLGAIHKVVCKMCLFWLSKSVLFKKSRAI